MTTEEENKAVVLRLIQAFNERDRDAFEASYADEFVAFHTTSGEERFATRLGHGRHG